MTAYNSMPELQNAWVFVVDSNGCNDTACQMLVVTDLVENFEYVLPYPNPSSSVISVSGNLENATYEIFNTLGAIVGHGKLEGGQIDIRDLPKGAYFITLVKDGLRIGRKFLKT